jgi:hypothetical protein
MLAFKNIIQMVEIGTATGIKRHLGTARWATL